MYADCDSSENETSVIWEAHKATIRGALIAKLSAIRKKAAQEIQSLESRLSALLSLHKSSPTAMVLSQIDSIRGQLNTLLSQRAAKILQKLRQRFYDKSDKIDSLLANKLRRKQALGAIDKLHSSQHDSYTYDPSVMSEEFRNFYSSLYNLPKPPLSLPSGVDGLRSYLSGVSLPVLSEDQQNILNAQISGEEILEAISSMRSSAAPGPDGFTAQYYKLFAKELIPTLFNNVFEGGSFLPETTKAEIVVIPKPDRDPTRCSNYRPISLLNVDLKIYAKILANRLAPLLPGLVHPDQVGFIPGRQAPDNTRRAIDLIHAIHKRKSPSLVLALDAEKAFDRISWSFAFEVLDTMGFTGNIFKGIQALYHSPSAYVSVNGVASSGFGISNGTRQGCPLSPLIFALVMEPLAARIRGNIDIRGVRTGFSEHKIALYADDVLLSLTNPATSLPSLLAELESYSQVSGYKINVDKTEVLDFYLPPALKRDLESQLPCNWNKQKIKYLGIYLTRHHHQLYQANYPRLLDNIKTDLLAWSDYFISWIGRINSVKMSVLPRLLYLFQTLPIYVPPSLFKTIQRQATHFIWNRRRPRVRLKLLQRSSRTGGLGIPDFRKYYLAAQLAQCVQWCNSGGMGKVWVRIETEEMGLASMSPLMWLSRTQRPRIVLSHPVIHRSLTLWELANRQFRLAPCPSPLVPLLHNPAFPPGMSRSALLNWLHNGILYLNDISTTSNFPQFSDIRENTTIPSSDFFRYLQIRNFHSTTLPTLSNRTLSSFEYICWKRTSTRGLISSIYSLLCEDSETSRESYIAAWEKDLGNPLDSEDWEEIWENAASSSLCVKIKENVYKILYRWYYVPTRLHRMFPEVSDRCWRGCADAGSFLHIWWSCPKLSCIWQEIAALLSRLFSTTISPDPKYFLLPLSYPDLTRHQNKLFRHVISAMTCQIATDWKLPSPSPMQAVLNRIWYVFKMEYMTAIIRNSAKSFHKVWTPWLEAQGVPSPFAL